MPALRAPEKLRTRRAGVKRITANAMECGLATFELEALVIPAIIPEPEADEKPGDHKTV